MHIHSKSLWIFIGILICLLLAGLFPSPTTIAVILVIGSLLIVWQTIMVLKDEE